MSLDGLPLSGANSNVVISGGTPSTIDNDANDNFSDVQFDYDTLADYTNNGDTPGEDTQYAQDVDVPTSAGLSSVSVKIGAFGLSAQNSTGNTPLSPDTKYVYWISDQPGATDNAETVNTFNPSSPAAHVTANPSYACYPTAYIAQNSYLSTLTTTGTVSGGLTAPIYQGGVAQTTPQPEIQGPCVYYYGNVSGSDSYVSPVGEFETPAIGKLSISSVAKVSGSKTTVQVIDKSDYKASGTLQLTTSSGKTLASGKFGMQPGKTEAVKLSLTSAGKKAAESHVKAKLVLNSNWDQPSVTKSVKL
jgi:hypothetical protein